MTLYLREVWETLFSLDGSARVDGAGSIVLPVNRSEDEVARLASLGFVAMGMAHDLGNLLQVVASAVGLIDRAMDVETRRRVEPLVRSALGSVDRAGELTRHLLDLGRAQHRPVQRFNPGDAVLGIVDLVSLAVGPRIEVRTLCGNAPAIRCDAREFENAILNLAVNARDAMVDGGRLTLSTHMERSPAGDASGRAHPIAAVCVQDTGSGMSAEVARHVFTPLYTTKAAGRGTGLGLAMVQDFARRQGGTVDLESEQGQGTSVTLRLPGASA